MTISKKYPIWATKSRVVENCLAGGVDLFSTVPHVMVSTVFSQEKTEEVGEPLSTQGFSAMPKIHLTVAKDGKAFAIVFSIIF